jgi:hypothetical protein
MTTKRRTYRVNADSWTVLKDILVGTPEPFNTDKATLRGREHCEGWGMLPEPDANEMIDSQVRYVIYSYDTPIAYRRIAEWECGGQPVYEWIIPDVRYSVTTSKHQGKVRTALSQITNGE